MDFCYFTAESVRFQVLGVPKLTISPNRAMILSHTVRRGTPRSLKVLQRKSSLKNILNWETNFGMVISGIRHTTLEPVEMQPKMSLNAMWTCKRWSDLLKVLRYKIYPHGSSVKDFELHSRLMFHTIYAFHERDQIWKRTYSDLIDQPDFAKFATQVASRLNRWPMDLSYKVPEI